MRVCYFLAFFIPVFVFSEKNHAQNLTRAEHQNRFVLNIARTSTPIRVDGDLNEPVWQMAAVTDTFWLKWPRDGGPAPEQTEVRCAYDDRFVYIAFVARDTSPDYVIQSIKRDVGYWDSDGVAVVLDPTNTGSNGYFFGVNPVGAQTEALLSAGNDELDTNWDNKWYVETRRYADRWTAEYAIPLRILRFKEGQTDWGINFIRNDLSNGVYSTWAQVPFQFDGTDVGWAGKLVWDASPRSMKGNYNIIPYATGAVSKDYEEKEPWKIQPNAGLDAKIGIGSGLNLDVTVRPDFSQVEIDEQVVNLTRFDVQLPEKRTFFLENGDLFGNFGIPPIRPFFSRRIGLNDDGDQLPILGGLRLTGNLGSDTRIGAMMMYTQKKDSTPARNNTALAINRRIFGRSRVSGYFLDRESFDGSERIRNQSSRNAGLETLFISKNSQWTSWLTHHRSFKPGIKDQNWWGNMGFNYRTRGFSWLTDVLHIGENYSADLGFEQRIENYDVVRDTTLRIGYNFVFNNFSYQIFPKSPETSRINFVELGGELFTVFNPGGSLNEASNDLYAQINFKNTSELSIGFSPNWANVPVPFKFDDDDDLTRCPALPAASYQFASMGTEWSSDYRKRFFVSVSAKAGSFYNGQQYGGGFELNGRIRRFMNLRLAVEYNRLAFPAPYCNVELFNLTPRVEVFFAKNLWWTTFIQYNTQADNFNINSRLQWRFRPMSDVFVVYTDNYAVQLGNVKNRALVAKVSYWF